MMRTAEMGERKHERRHRETMQDMKDRHEEVLRALDALIDRTAPR